MNVVRHRKTDPAQPHRHNSVVSLSAAEKPLTEANIELPLIEGPESIQLALSIVINAVAAGTLDTARAKVLLTGLRIASSNARHLRAQPKVEVIHPDRETSDDHTSTQKDSASQIETRKEIETAPQQTEAIATTAHGADRDQTWQQKKVTSFKEKKSYIPEVHSRGVSVLPSCFSPTNIDAIESRQRLETLTPRTE
jgi:hypothetical protein